MNKNLLYYTQKTKRKKEPHCMGKMRAMRIIYLFKVFYIFFSQKKLWIVYTCDNSIWGAGGDRKSVV